MYAPQRLKGFYCGLSHRTIASTRVLSTISQVVRIGYCVSWMVGRQQTQSVGSPEACERGAPSSSLGSRRFGKLFAPMIFRRAQRLRLALPLYVRHLEGSLRGDVARLFEVSGLWVRNVVDRRRTKRSTLQIIRRIISRLKTPTNSVVAGSKPPLLVT